MECASGDVAAAIWLGPQCGMKAMAATKFKNLCLKTLDEVERTRSAVVITKWGRPVAKLVPCGPEASPLDLASSVFHDKSDPFGTGERWDADLPEI